MSTALLPKDAIPKEFTLSASPNEEGEVVVHYKSEKIDRELGRYKVGDLNGMILTKIFPKIKIPWMVEMGLRGFKLPTSFYARAYPDGDEVVLSLSIPLKEGATPWLREKRVKVREWDLAQMGELLGWVKEARKLDNKA